MSTAPLYIVFTACSDGLEYYAGIGGSNYPEHILWSEDESDAAKLSLAVAEYIAKEVSGSVKKVPDLDKQESVKIEDWQ